VFVVGLAVAVFLVFLARVAYEPRSFGNAVLLGLALALGALAVAERLALTPGPPAHLLLLLLASAVALGPLAVGGYLVINGITMALRESLRLANLLSLGAGLGVFAVIALDVLAERVGEVSLSLFSTVCDLGFGYVSFLFVSYVFYAAVYGRIARPGAADFVIVLGQGLRANGTVPPMLASRLDQGRAIWERLAADAPDGARPVLIVSGGKGGDERVSEAAAMAAYLLRRGFPADAIAAEDRSRNTEENLRFSKAIMDERKPGCQCVIVTSDFHAFRAALIGRRLGIRGQVAGAPVARYFQPSALLREFAAVFLSYRLVNLAICAFLVAAPVGTVALHQLGGARLIPGPRPVESARSPCWAARAPGLVRGWLR
jgi:uncharacterized SAM-binding protein YcdF (DUF218 family)